MGERRSGQTFRFWLPALLWLGVIAIESTSFMSAEHTGGIVFAVLRWIFPHIASARLELIHLVLRKTGHFVGYAILSLFLFRALRATVMTNLARLWIWSVGLTCIVASLDEWHQMFLPARTASLRDVALDTMGAMVMQTVVLIVVLVRRLSGHSQASVA